MPFDRNCVEAAEEIDFQALRFPSIFLPPRSIIRPIVLSPSESLGHAGSFFLSGVFLR